MAFTFCFLTLMSKQPCKKVKAVKVKVAQSCQSLCDPMDYTVHGILQGKNTGVGSLSLLHGIIPTQGSNPGLLHCRQILTSWATIEAHHVRSLEQLRLPCYGRWNSMERPWRTSHKKKKTKDYQGTEFSSDFNPAAVLWQLWENSKCPNLNEPNRLTEHDKKIINYSSH